MQDRYLDLQRLSEYSSISVRTLREYLSHSDSPIPSYQIKRKILVKQSEFDSWMDRHKVDANYTDAVVDGIVNDLHKQHYAH